MGVILGLHELYRGCSCPIRSYFSRAAAAAAAASSAATAATFLLHWVAEPKNYGMKWKLA